MRDDVEPAEVKALLDAVVEPQIPGEDDIAELMYLNGRLALVEAVADEIRGLRGSVTVRLLDQKVSLRAIADHLGVNHNAPKQWADAARKVSRLNRRRRSEDVEVR